MENCLVHRWLECAVQEAPNSVTAFFVRLKEKDECIVCCSITDCEASTADDYCYYYWCVIKSTMTSSPLYGVCGENYWSRLIFFYYFFFSDAFVNTFPQTMWTYTSIRSLLFGETASSYPAEVSVSRCLKVFTAVSQFSLSLAPSLWHRSKDSQLGSSEAEFLRLS